MCIALMARSRNRSHPGAQRLSAKPAHAVARCMQAVEGDLTLIFSAAELDEIVAANPGKVVVVFGALTWCRPCKAMQRPVQVGGARGGISHLKKG